MGLAGCDVVKLLDKRRRDSWQECCVSDMYSRLNLELYALITASMISPEVTPLVIMKPFN